MNTYLVPGFVTLTYSFRVTHRDTRKMKLLVEFSWKALTRSKPNFFYLHTWSRFVCKFYASRMQLGFLLNIWLLIFMWHDDNLPWALRYTFMPCSVVLAYFQSNGCVGELSLKCVFDKFLSKCSPMQTFHVGSLYFTGWHCKVTLYAHDVWNFI